MLLILTASSKPSIGSLIARPLQSAGTDLRFGHVALNFDSWALTFSYVCDFFPIGYAVPNRYQHRMNLLVPKNVRCQHRKFGADLALIWHLCRDCSYLCQIGANIGNLVLIWLRFGTSVEIAVTCAKSVPTLEI